MLALVVNGRAVAPALAIGVIGAAMYAMLALAIVLTFRISRTVPFVHFGFAVVGILGYWILTYPSNLLTAPGHRPVLPHLLAFAILMAVGVVLGAAYGAVMTHRRIAHLPRFTLTLMSLTAMLLLFGFMTCGLFYSSAWDSPMVTGLLPGRYVRVFGTNIDDHRLVVLAATIALVVALGWVINRTRSGIAIRAIADDVEASLWSGINLPLIGTATYAASGAIAVLAGAFLEPVLGPDPGSLFFVFLRALTVAVLGGFRSFGLALGGALLLGLIDSSLRSGVFGTTTIALNETVIVAVLIGVVVVVSRLHRPTLENIEVETL